MRKTYAAPKADKLDFDYTDVVVASGGSGNSSNKGDNGNGKGCKGTTYIGKNNRNQNQCTAV